MNGELVETDLLLEKLTADDVKALGDCFNSQDQTVFTGQLRVEVRDRLLPRLAARMGWKAGAVCSKLRANDAKSVSIRYNSDFHRDRHLFGTAPQGSIVRRKGAWANLSAVIYLDPASFEYFEESAWSHPKESTPVLRTFEAGTMIIFPSSLVHKASHNPALETNRRTVILFDIESAESKNSKIPHAVICMPSGTQFPIWHYTLGPKFVEFYLLGRLFNDGMYWWRCIPNWCRTVELSRVHWQATMPENPTWENEEEVKLNSSIYMPVEYTRFHKKLYDYRPWAVYVLRLIDSFTFGFYHSH
jgi:hypothetical protein